MVGFCRPGHILCTLDLTYSYGFFYVKQSFTNLSFKQKSDTHGYAHSLPSHYGGGRNQANNQVS